MAEDDYEVFEEEGEATGISNRITEERQIYIRTFIHFVEPNSQLYAKKTKGYCKGQDNVLTWAQIGGAMTPPMDGTEASKLFHKLREKFGKERKKVLKSMPRSGAGAGVATYSSPWIFYKDLVFLTNHIQARETSTNIVRRVVTPAVRPSGPASPALPQSLPAPRTVNAPSLSPAWNSDLSWLNSPASAGSSSSATDQCQTEDSNDSTQTPSPSMLKAMAASIAPAKSVPPSDTCKKRKRSSDQLRETINDSQQEIKVLASSLGDALKNFTKPAPAPAPKPPSIVPLQVEAMMQPIVIAFSRVPEADQLTCMQAMLGAVMQFVPKTTSN